MHICYEVYWFNYFNLANQAENVGQIQQSSTHFVETCSLNLFDHKETIQASFSPWSNSLLLNLQGSISSLHNVCYTSYME